MPAYHLPVLLREAVEGLAVRPGGIYVDVTYGGGGHSRLILQQLGAGRLFAFDQDADARSQAVEDSRLVFIHQNFRHMKRMLRAQGISSVDGILADLGISSYQVDTASRGFAYRLEGPLDMRMDQGMDRTAAGIVQTYDAAELQRVFSDYGEVRNAKSLAAQILSGRKGGYPSTIAEFLELIGPVVRGHRARYLSQVFQALRMEVNDELDALRDLLMQATDMLHTGGRLVVITYHSLEDRIVKQMMKTGNPEGIVKKDDFGHAATTFRLITRKPVEASAGEVIENPRARSARLRIAEKLSV